MQETLNQQADEQPQRDAPTSLPSPDSTISLAESDDEWRNAPTSFEPLIEENSASYKLPSVAQLQAMAAELKKLNINRPLPIISGTRTLPPSWRKSNLDDRGSTEEDNDGDSSQLPTNATPSSGKGKQRAESPTTTSWTPERVRAGLPPALPPLPDGHDGDVVPMFIAEGSVDPQLTDPAGIIRGYLEELLVFDHTSITDPSTILHAYGHWL
jgi:hypothetical protein